MSVNPKLAVQPDMAFLVDLIRRGALVSTNCHALGTVRSFDSSNQSAQVTLNYKRVVNGEAKSYPVLADCPTIVMQGGGGRLTFPIEPGDNCLILFNDVNMDTWVSSGNTGAAPTDARSHAFADAIALVGLNPFNNALSDYFEDGVELASTEGSSLQLSDVVDLTADAGALLGLTSKVNLNNTVGKSLGTVLTEILTALNTLLTAYAGYSAAPTVTGAQIATPAAAAAASLALAQTDVTGLLT